MFFLSSSKKRLKSWIEQDYGELPVSCTSLGTHRFPGSPAGLKEVEIFSFTMKDGEEHAGFVGPVVWSFWVKGMASEPLEALAKGYLGWLIATMANDNKQLTIEDSVGDRGIEIFFKHLIGEGVDPGKLTVTKATTYRLHNSEVYEFAFQARKSDSTISMKTVLNGQDALSVMDNDPWYQLPQLYYFLGHILSR